MYVLSFTKYFFKKSRQNPGHLKKKLHGRVFDSEAIRRAKIIEPKVTAKMDFEGNVHVGTKRY